MGGTQAAHGRRIGEAVAPWKVVCLADRAPCHFSDIRSQRLMPCSQSVLEQARHSTSQTTPPPSPLPTKKRPAVTRYAHPCKQPLTAASSRDARRDLKGAAQVPRRLRKNARRVVPGMLLCWRAYCRRPPWWSVVCAACGSSFLLLSHPGRIPLFSRFSSLSRHLVRLFPCKPCGRIGFYTRGN